MLFYYSIHLNHYDIPFSPHTYMYNMSRYNLELTELSGNFAFLCASYNGSSWCETFFGILASTHITEDHNGVSFNLMFFHYLHYLVFHFLLAQNVCILMPQNGQLLKPQKATACMNHCGTFTFEACTLKKETWNTCEVPRMSHLIKAKCIQILQEFGKCFLKSLGKPAQNDTCFAENTY